MYTLLKASSICVMSIFVILFGSINLYGMQTDSKNVHLLTQKEYLLITYPHLTEFQNFLNFILEKRENLAFFLEHGLAKQYPNYKNNIATPDKIETENKNLAQENICRELDFFSSPNGTVSIGISDYLERLFSYLPCSESIFIVTMIYVQRYFTNLIADYTGEINQENILFLSKSVIEKQSLHRILLASMVVALKHFEDIYFSNQFSAKVGGVSNKELNNLEINFLWITHFDLCVSKTEFECFESMLLNTKLFA